MKWTTIRITAGLAVGLALGVAFGPTIRGSAATAQTPSAPQMQAGGPGNAIQSLFLDNLAASLKIQRTALDSAITSAGTSTLDAAAQQGTLTQAQANALKARLQAGDLGVLWGGRGRGPDGPHKHAVHQAMIDAAAKALSITPEQLHTQLRSGQTLAQLAQTHNTTEQSVIDTALAAAKTKLAQEVADGRLTQTQADTIYAQLQRQGAQLFTPRGRGPGGHGPGRMRTMPAPDTGAEG